MRAVFPRGARRPPGTCLGSRAGRGGLSSAGLSQFDEVVEIDRLRLRTSENAVDPLLEQWVELGIGENVDLLVLDRSEHHCRDGRHIEAMLVELLDQRLAELLDLR